MALDPTEARERIVARRRVEDEFCGAEWAAVAFEEGGDALHALGRAAPGAPVSTRERMRWLVARHSEPAWLEAQIRALTPLRQFVLDHAIREEGSLELGELLFLLDQLGVEPQLVVPLCDGLVHQGLAFLVMDEGLDAPALRLTNEVALAACRLVAHLSTPADAVPPEGVHGRHAARDLAAMLALTTHRPMALTAKGEINRARLRLFAQGLGLAADAIAEHLARSIDLGLIDPTVPEFAPVLAVARGFFARPEPALLDPAFRFLGSRWVSEKGLTLSRDGKVVGAELFRRRFQLAGEWVELDGTLYLRRSPMLRSGGDGHITPNFEVLLGPAADPWITLVVGMAAELQHLDHVLTHKLSPASVARGLAAGLTLDELEAALRRVSGRPIPDTVQALLDDTARRVVNVRTVYALGGTAASLDALAARLGDAVVGRPAPDCLLVASEETASRVTTACTASGIALTGKFGALPTGPMLRSPKVARRATLVGEILEDPDVARQRREHERMSERTREGCFEAPIERTCDPALRDRFFAAARSNFSAERRALRAALRQAPVAPPPPPRLRSLVHAPPRAVSPAGGPLTPAVRRAAPAVDADAALRSWAAASTRAREEGRAVDARWLGMAAEALLAFRPEAEAWAARLDESGFVGELLDDERAPAIAFLAPEWRMRLLSNFDSVETLLERAEESLSPTRLGPHGRKARALLAARGAVVPTRARVDERSSDAFDDDDDEDGFAE